jgi:hypothetical protein
MSNVIARPPPIAGTRPLAGSKCNTSPAAASTVAMGMSRRQNNGMYRASTGEAYAGGWLAPVTFAGGPAAL